MFSGDQPDPEPEELIYINIRMEMQRLFDSCCLKNLLISTAADILVTQQHCRLALCYPAAFSFKLSLGNSVRDHKDEGIFSGKGIESCFPFCF